MGWCSRLQTKIHYLIAIFTGVYSKGDMVKKLAEISSFYTNEPNFNCRVDGKNQSCIAMTKLSKFTARGTFCLDISSFLRACGCKNNLRDYTFSEVQSADILTKPLP